ncbi:aldehyde dehydrogenase family protein [Rhodococcus tukisamuensis]|uniref:Aldehyde dehydrogenase n=1 Tax=Rhodococcus tukisamuensis TaxID=168276 RepID=A0A1G7DZ67_9NOCA|nr:aldehyde dehydrogenase family protein [Rhodococcus tukisamuensis]SDE56560.1 coniferyl-aldehyde dehydrogenase [Rhodococcus tukisamuensis]
MDPNSSAATRLTDLLDLQRRAHLAEGQSNAEQRRHRIQRVIDLLVARADDIAKALDADFGGRPEGYSLMNDVVGSITALKHARDNLDTWMAPDERPVFAPYDQLGARARVLHQPKGTVGIIGTWNAPVYTLMSPLAGVLAAGNRAVLKPSEVVPRTAEVLADAVATLLDPAEVAIVTGGPDVADALTSLPLDHLVFTGSSAVGKLVMANAAQNLVPVTLELGGKSPTVIGRGADLADAAHRIAVGKATNGGQICVSPDTVHVPRERIDEFVTALREAYTALLPTIDGNADAVAIVSDRHAARIDGYVADAADRGARVESAPDVPLPATGRRRPLRMVIEPPADAVIRQEEIFGPAVVLLGYDAIDEVVDAINAGPKPLALYYFGTDTAEQEAVVGRTSSGGVTINEVMMHPGLQDAPFGGVGASGMGHYNGREGFLEFSHARAVYESAGPDLRGEWGMLPPYTDQFRAMMAAQVTP